MILLTGATGFLGGAVLADGLARMPEASWLLPVRAPSPGAALDRVRASVARFDGAAAVDARCRVVPVDLAAPGAAAALPLREVTHSLHLAANTSFRPSPEVWLVNRDAAVAWTAALCDAPALVRHVHVGTAMICGRVPPGVVAEERYPDPAARHLVEYTASKAAGELALSELVGRMPLVVARPSIVVGHSRRGCAPSGSIFWVFRALDRLGATPWDPRGAIDVVPVDWVASALLTLLFRPRLEHRVYHVSAGRAGAADWGEIARAFGRAEGYRRAPFEACPSELCDLEAAIRLYFEFAALDVVFDNARLLGEGVAPPPRFVDYLGRCVATSPASIAEQAGDDR